MSAPAAARRPRFFFEFPLLKREFVSVLRTRRAFWLLLAVVGLCSLIPLLGWADMQGRSMQPGQIAGIFLFFANVQLFATVLIIPAFTAGAISGEREAQTYDLLYSTLLSPASIIFSKVLSSIGYVVILLAASAPMAFSLYLLGGIGFEAILQTYVVTLVAVVSSGIICLAASMRSARTAQAAVRGIVSVAFWNGGLSLVCVAVAYGLYQAFGYPMGSMYQNTLVMFAAFAMNPMYAMASSVYQGMMPFQLPLLEPWQAYCVYIGLIALFHVVYLLRRVQTPDLPTATLKSRRRAAIRKRRNARQLTHFSKFVIGLGEKGVPLLRNPVFLREARAEFFGRPWYRRAMFWGPLAAFCLMTSLGHRLDTKVAGATMVVITFVVLLVPALVASTIPRERELGSFDFLRGSLLRMRDIVLGKYLAGLYSCVGLFAACAWVVLVSACLVHRREGSLGPILLASLVVPTVAALFYAALAIFAAVISKRTLGALLITYGIVLFLLLGIPLLYGIADEFVGNVEWDFVPITNPYVTSFGLFEDWRSSGLSVFFWFATVHVVGTVALLGLSVYLLKRHYSRDT